MARRKKKKLKSEIAKEQRLLEAKTKKEADKLRQEIEKDARRQLRAMKKRAKAYSKKYYDEAEDVRTPEQIEISAKNHQEVIDLIDGKYFVYSKFGNKLYPHVVWRKYKPKDPNTPREIRKVVERVIEKEVVIPNDTYYNYAETRDPVPEEVIMIGYKDILASYGIEHLDDYNVRKLFYHTLLSIAHYLDINPQFYLNLSDMHIFKESVKRNVFTVVIPSYSHRHKNTTVDSLYQYFVGGDMDFEALHKTLDVYAMSYIKYTEVKKSLTDKARDSYNRYRLMQEMVADAKAMLKAQGIVGGKGYRKLLQEMTEKLTAENKIKNRSRIKKLREEDEKKLLTEQQSHDIIEEKEEE